MRSPPRLSLDLCLTDAGHAGGRAVYTLPPVIALKYPSKCNGCSRMLPKGTKAYWRKGNKGVRCRDCAEDLSTFTIRYYGPAPRKANYKA